MPPDALAPARAAFLQYRPIGLGARCEAVIRHGRVLKGWSRLRALPGPGGERCRLREVVPDAFRAPQRGVALMGIDARCAIGVCVIVGMDPRCGGISG